MMFTTLLSTLLLCWEILFREMLKSEFAPAYKMLFGDELPQSIGRQHLAS